MRDTNAVIPRGRGSIGTARGETHNVQPEWIPACAGMTMKKDQPASASTFRKAVP